MAEIIDLWKIVNYLGVRVQVLESNPSSTSTSITNVVQEFFECDKYK